MATLKELAKMTGLSVNTVSRVIRGKGYISAKTLKLVRDAVRKAGYQPNLAARALRRQDPHEFAVLIDGVDHTIADKMAGIRETALANGFQTRFFLAQDEYQHSSFTVFLREILNNSYSGAILVTSRREFAVHNDEIRRHFPCVWMIPDPIPGLDCISADRFQGASEIVSFLYAKGKRRIAYYAGNYSEGNKAGYLKTIQNFDLEPNVISGSLKNPLIVHNKAYSYAKTFPSLENPPDAIITTIPVATGLMAGFSETGWKIPEQTALVILENTEITTYLHPQLTALTQPSYEMGKTAIGLLLKRIQEPTGDPLAARLKMALIERQST